MYWMMSRVQLVSGDNCCEVTVAGNCYVGCRYSEGNVNHFEYWSQNALAWARVRRAGGAEMVNLARK